MTFRSRPVHVVILASLCFVAPRLAVDAHAQILYETVHEFRQGPGRVFGRLIQASDGNLYGVTSEGGAYSGGTVFVVRKAAGVWQPAVTLHDFVPATEGDHPFAGLTETSPGVFYGVTSRGGAHGGGTIFRLSSFGVMQVLRALTPATDGGNVRVELTRGLDGNLYGAASSGGPGGTGTIFRITPSGTFTRLHAFAGPDGDWPSGALSLAFDGNFYGVTRYGGLSDGGTMYRMSHAGAFTQIATPLGSPIGKLALLPDGTFYGISTAETSCCGGEGRFPGQPFHVTTAGVSLDAGRIPHATFDFDSASTNALTLGPDGWLYGANYSGIYRINYATLASEWVAEFDDATHAAVGGSIDGALVMSGDGNVYGATDSGGLEGYGVVLSVNRSSGDMAIVHAFRSDGFSPTGAPLVLGTAMYFTTFGGGRSALGTVSSRSGNGLVSTLASIPAGLNTGNAFGNLMWHPYEAKLFGTTTKNVFSVDVNGDGDLDLRVSTFVTSPSTPVVGADTAAYVTVQDAVLRITPASWEVVTRFGFTGPRVAVGGLVRGSDGFLYGTTRYVDDVEGGVVFRLELDGTLTVLHQFNDVDGRFPAGNLIEGTDGFLYGTTLAGGAFGIGTVFKVSKDGAFTSLHSFAAGEGNSPVAGLAQFSNGVFYGTTVLGGTFNRGTVYAVTSDGQFATLHNFAPGQGAIPIGGVAEGPDGFLYGTTYAGGQANVGVIYRLSRQP